MTVNVHNPDQYMAGLRQIIAQGRKRIGFIVGAGAPASILTGNPPKSLIPTVSGLTREVIDNLSGQEKTAVESIISELGATEYNIELILSKTRNLSSIIGSTKIHGLNGNEHKVLSENICKKIGSIVDKSLPSNSTPYHDLVTWLGGSDRDHAIEIFTTNYDLLFEEAFENARIPYFDGFSGSKQAFFDPSTVASDILPARWARLWKLHGSVGWTKNSKGEVIRDGKAHSTDLIFPEHLKYEQTQKAPYSALFDRLRQFLMTPDTLLIATGFSFGDAHISGRIDECLTANKSSSVFAFQHNLISEEKNACDIAGRCSNMSVYCSDGAMINGVRAQWMPGDLPTRDWGPIRSTYWDAILDGGPPVFILGKYDRLAKFFSASRTEQIFPETTILNTNDIARS
jgi:hypothetical protein